MKLGNVIPATLLMALLAGCGDGMLTVDYPTVGPDNLQTVASELRPDQRLTRATLIRDAAAQKGLTNAALLAGIAEVETNFAHCWSEARWACQGPASSSCGGGPVIAGSADGPCSHRQGGLGMFQFDAGNYDETLAREGRRILTVEGNTQAAVDFVVDKVRISAFIPNINTNAQALAWMNGLRPDTVEWDQWIRTVTGYYNGCFEGRCSKFHSQYNKYDSKTRAMLNEFGAGFWGGAASTGAPSTGAADPGGAAATAPAGRPVAATDLQPASASVPSGGSIGTRWNALGATRFVIRMEYFIDGMWKYYWEWTRNTTVFEIWPQVPNVAYRWAVQACNDQGCADWSPWAMFTVGNATLPGSQPADNTNTAGSNTGSSNTGSSNTGSNTGSNPDPNTGSSSNTSAPEPQPEPQPEPEPQASSGVPGMPASMAPAGVYVDTPGVPLTWSEPMGAETYDVVMYYFDGVDWRDYYTWENKTSGAFTVWPVVDETYYAWAVRSCNGFGCSDWSDFQQFFFAGL